MGLKYILNDNNAYLREMFIILKDEKKTKAFEKKINMYLKQFEGNKAKYDELKKLDNNSSAKALGLSYFMWNKHNFKNLENKIGILMKKN